MICENCSVIHNGKYGSGRFCSSKCSRSYSTKINREEINKKVSRTLKNNYQDKEFKIKMQNRKYNTKPAQEKIKDIYLDLLLNGNWNDIPLTIKKKRVLLEQENKCSICSINNWRDKPITLHFDHIDGNNKNNLRENVRYICPNCHSQTETYCGKKQKLPQYNYLKTTKEKLYKAV